MRMANGEKLVFTTWLNLGWWAAIGEFATFYWEAPKKQKNIGQNSLTILPDGNPCFWLRG